MYRLACDKKKYHFGNKQIYTVGDYKFIVVVHTKDFNGSCTVRYTFIRKTIAIIMHNEKYQGHLLFRACRRINV